MKGNVDEDFQMIVAYPPPRTLGFDKVYQQEHVRWPIANLHGRPNSRNRRFAIPQSDPPVYCIAEVYFPRWKASSSAPNRPEQGNSGHAAKISSGGPPVIMIAEEILHVLTLVSCRRYASKPNLPVDRADHCGDQYTVTAAPNGMLRCACDQDSTMDVQHREPTIPPEVRSSCLTHGFKDNLGVIPARKVAPKELRKRPNFPAVKSRGQRGTSGTRT